MKFEFTRFAQLNARTGQRQTGTKTNTLTHKYNLRNLKAHNLGARVQNALTHYKTCQRI